MAKSKVCDLGRDKITVRELTLEEISTLFNKSEKNAVEGIINMLETCSNAKMDELRKMAPSDMQPLMDDLVEVNSSFLGQCRQVNNEEMAESFETLLRQVSLIAFSLSLPQDTESEPGNTAIANSSKP